MLDLRTRRHDRQVAVTPPPVVPGLPPTGVHGPGQPGRRRVFTGDWLANGCDCHLYTDGYIGDLVRHWNGWNVFRATRSVADAVVAHHQNTVTGLIAEHASRGAHLADAWLATLRQIASVTWIGSLIVVDARLYADDETHIEISTPDADGLYTVGWGWMWDTADVADVHTVHGATNT